MFVAYQWDDHHGEWIPKYFNHKENAEEYIRKLLESGSQTYRRIHEIQTED